MSSPQTQPASLDAIAREGSQFNPPPDYDHAEVIPGLYVGAFPSASPFDWGADVVVSLASAHACQSVPRNKLLIHLPIIEGEAPPDEVRRLARLIASLLDDGLCVFVHCVAGRDRSPMLCARVLIEQGLEPRDAIQHVRAARVGSLGEGSGGASATSRITYASWLLSEGSAS
jgi:Polymorphic toxin system, DSP-PTPase phosphatase